MTRRVDNAVILDGPAAAMLWTAARLSDLRIAARGRDERLYGLLLDIYRTALAHSDSLRGKRATESTEPNEPEDIMHTTPAKLARQLGVHPRTVRNDIERGLLPAQKVGRAWIIRADAADAYLNSRKAA
jgi:excisionase family DNA binding protein